MKTRILWAAYLSVALATSSFAADRTSSRAARPNILWLIAEDFGPHLGSLHGLMRCVPPTAAAADVFEMARRRMVQQIVRDVALKNERVIDAMGRVPRHLFVPGVVRSEAYHDLSLAIGHDQTISAPWAVAYMTEQIDPQPGDRVLEIGTGSGYQAAVLSGLVAEVYTIEIVPELAQRAKRTLERLKYNNVSVKAGDGFKGWAEHAPFDKIIVTCSPEKVPEPLVEQLKEGGRMLIPVGERYQQKLYLMEKKEGKLVEQALVELVFVPMTGQAEKLREVQPDPANPALFNGDFELDENKDNEPDGWHYRRQCKRVKGEAPQGDAYVSLRSSIAGRDAVALQMFAVDGRKVPALDVAFWVRCRQVREGPGRALPQLAVTFYGERRQELRSETLGPWRGSLSWNEVQGAVPVPPEAREGILRIALMGAVGEIAFDDVRIAAGARRGR